MPLGALMLNDSRNRGLAKFAREQLEENHRRLDRLQARNAREIVANTHTAPRPASELLTALGHAECPPDTPAPAPELVRECRKALGMTQATLSWELGGSRGGGRIGRTEKGLRQLTRPERLLLRRLMERLDTIERTEKLTWG